MGLGFDRRRFLGGLGATGFALALRSHGRAQTTFAFGLPIADPGGLSGDGFIVRHGFQTENTWYNPGHWHTAEDWYRLNGADTAGAQVLAVAEGEVVFLGSDYPGRVIVIEHAPNLYSMYGHLAPESVTVAQGSRVARGQQLATVATVPGWIAPSHLHFEIRTFLYEGEVNGESPRYAYSCGLNCAPGPGYWPMEAPELPAGMGWRNPTHISGNRLLLDGTLTVQVPQSTTGPVSLRSVPWQWEDSYEIGLLDLYPGAQFTVLAVDSGHDSSTGTSA
ncbi:MAG: M23 family metallopeptidase, partial [Thermomicrobiales bacterium]|nr:M23 family metallopeptidase [Thermomicrobiales bacterium]